MLKNFLRASLFLLATSLAGLSLSAEVAVSATVGDLSWMSGSWSGPAGEQTLEENWARSRDGSIGALVRLGADGVTSMFELIVVEETEGSLVLRIQQWGPGMVPLRAEPQVLSLAELGERRVKFAATATVEGGFRTLAYSRPSAEAFNIDVENQDGAQFQINLQAQ
jgi:hypothetical protein